MLSTCFAGLLVVMTASALDQLLPQEELVELRSCDGQVFRVPESTASQSTILKGLIKGRGGLDKQLKISEVNGKVLAKALEYCTRRAQLSSEDKLQAYDREFAEDVHNMLFDLLRAANFLGIEPLLDLASRTIADQIKGKTPEEIRDFICPCNWAGEGAGNATAMPIFESVDGWSLESSQLEDLMPDETYVVVDRDAGKAPTISQMNRTRTSLGFQPLSAEEVQVLLEEGWKE